MPDLVSSWPSPGNTSSSADGGYLFPLLPVGFYSVNVEAPGFERYEQRGIEAPHVRAVGMVAPPEHHDFLALATRHVVMVLELGSTDGPGVPGVEEGVEG